MEEDNDGYLLFIFTCVVFLVVFVSIINVVRNSFKSVPYTPPPPSMTLFQEQLSEDKKEASASAEEIEKQRKEYMERQERKMKDIQRMRK